MNDKPSHAINIDLQAKASLEAKITAEIPKESSGRLLDAVVDIFRPFTESRGLTADRIKLEREKVAIQIANLAQERISTEGAAAQIPPIKFTVPFFEKASLEQEHESELIKLWAHLLATASMNYSPNLVRFSSVLSELGPSDVFFLKKIIYKSKGKVAFGKIEDTPHVFTDREIATTTKLEYKNQNMDGYYYDPYVHDFDLFLDKFIETSEYPGSIWVSIVIYSSKNKELVGEYENEEWKADHHDTASNLISLGLLQEFSIGDEFRYAHISGSGYAITRFCLNFLMACDRDFKKQIELEST